MSVANIVINPRLQSIDDVINLASQIKDILQTEIEELYLDFQVLGWIQPFAMLFLSKYITDCVIKHTNVKFFFKNLFHQTYAAHMGFFQNCKVDYGKLPGEASGGKNYLPITVIKRSDLEMEARALLEVNTQKIIENHSKRLASALTQQDSGNLVYALTFSLREIIRNVFEHSESDSCSYCAQFWPRRNLVEIALIDSGIGIRKSLSKNPLLEINSDKDAITQCLLPGISGKSFGQPSRKSSVDERDYEESVWENSGFGLYMVSRLCRNGGNFFIASKSAAVHLSENQKKKIYSIDIDGTALRMIMRVDKLGKVSDLLPIYASEGEKIASKLHKGRFVPASVASKMLASDWQYPEEQHDLGDHVVSV